MAQISKDVKELFCSGQKVRRFQFSNLIFTVLIFFFSLTLFGDNFYLTEGSSSAEKIFTEESLRGILGKRILALTKQEVDQEAPPKKVLKLILKGAKINCIGRVNLRLKCAKLLAPAKKIAQLCL